MSIRICVLSLAMAVAVCGLAGCQLGRSSGGSSGAGVKAINVPKDVVDVSMTASDHAFEPARVTVAPGKTVRLKLANEGNVPHTIELHLASGEAELEPELEPGDSGTLIFVAPHSPGAYTYYCPIGDHREQGMVGQLVVKQSAEH
ncbi:MAG: cupredoxin domain-containing protein [Planctomycetota bacterium]